MREKIQLSMFGPAEGQPLKGQLLKWIGNKQRVAKEIISFFPQRFGTYFEPFLGSGGVLATLAPVQAIGSDSFSPLMEIWQTLQDSPETLKQWYAERWNQMTCGVKVKVFEAIKNRYNANPNGGDLLFICRSCYGGVVRFRQKDGFISTPCGIHDPISPDSFSGRVDIWRERVSGTRFKRMEFRQSLEMARAGDLVYCDPPYSHTQGILYGAQSFSLKGLLQAISECKARGAFVALSIDGTKKSGNTVCHIPIPKGLFEREVFIPCGRSMLKRFQMNGKTLEEEHVSDRLLLTY
jgi:DNA adenine methylase